MFAPVGPAVEAPVQAFEARLIGEGAPFELVPNSTGSISFRHGPHTLPDLFNRARRLGDKILFVQDGLCYSYGEIFTRAAELVATLKHLEKGGVGKRIGLALNDGPEWLVWLIAITTSGASCVLLQNGSGLISDQIAAANCQSVVADPDLGLLHPDNIFALAGRSDLSQDYFSEGMDPASEALVTFSSGSTGHPKGIVHSHRSLLSALRNMMLGGAITSRMLPPTAKPLGKAAAPVTLVTSPLCYVAGYSALFLALATGGTVVFERAGVTAEIVVSHLSEYSISSIGGASVDLIRRVIRMPDIERKATFLSRIYLQGAGLSLPLVAEIEATLPNVIVMTGYGMSETGGTLASAPVSALPEGLGTCGRLLPSVQARCVSIDGCELSAGQTGRLQIRGDMLMDGYLDAGQTGKVTDADGWFSTGDLAHIDADGWLFVVARDEPSNELSEVRSAVENSIGLLPGVDEAILQDPSDDMRWKLFLQTDDRYAVDLELIETRVKVAAPSITNLSVVRSPTLPRTMSGKVDRARLGV